MCSILTITTGDSSPIAFHETFRWTTGWHTFQVGILTLRSAYQAQVIVTKTNLHAGTNFFHCIYKLLTGNSDPQIPLEMTPLLPKMSKVSVKFSWWMVMKWVLKEILCRTLWEFNICSRKVMLSLFTHKEGLSPTSPRNYPLSDGPSIFLQTAANWDQTRNEIRRHFWLHDYICWKYTV